MFFQRILILSVFLVFCLNFRAYAEDSYNLSTFNTDKGLPHNHVRYISQDSTGFLWIATWDGLSRYDGYDFKNYYHDPEDSTSIPYFNVEKLVIDCFNNVWVSSLGRHPVIYDRANDNFYPAGNIYEDFINQEVDVDTGGYVWQWHSIDGLSKYDYEHQSFIKFKVVDELGNEFPVRKITGTDLAFDNENNIWILAIENQKEAALCFGTIIDDQTVRMVKTSIDVTLLYSGKMISHTISITPLVTQKGETWLFTNVGAFIFDLKEKQLKIPYQRVPPGDIMNIVPITWSGAENLVYVHYPGEAHIKEMHFNDDCLTHFTLPGKDKTVWISRQTTEGEGTGLIKAIPVTGFFRHYFLDTEENGRKNAFFGVMKDRNGEVWGAPRNLPYLLKQECSGIISKLAEHNIEYPLNQFHPRAFLDDSTGIWIGYYLNRLVFYSYSNGEFNLIPNGLRPDDMTRGYGYRNLIMQDSLLIFNNDLNIGSYNIASGEFSVFYKMKSDNPVYCLRNDGKGGFWVGMSRSQILHFNEKHQIDREIRVSKGMFNVEDICQGEQNDLWLALLGGGLCHFFPETGKSEIFTTAQGLSNNTCYSIIRDRKGFLWISTNHGISRFNPKNGKFRIFGPSDGLKIDEFNSDASFEANDGEIFFGGMGGAVSFYPDSLIENILPMIAAPLVITELKTSGLVHFFNRPVYELDTVKLGKGDDNFSASFVCLDFQNPDKIRYRYRLTGDNMWTETDYLHRTINYAHLDPGEYLLELESTNRNGDWVSHRELLLVIPPFFYQSIWFKLLLTFLFLSFISYVIYGYNRQIRMKARQQQEELRLETLRGQMNPHFIFNSLNSINYFISQNDRLSANRYIADFSRLIRAILGNMSMDYIHLQSELESLNDYLKLEHLRFGDKFEYVIHLPEELNESDMLIFPGMVQPFVENAIWHGVRGLEGRKGKIEITFREIDNKRLVCIVEDNGLGCKLTEQRINHKTGRKSRGIEIVMERLAIMNHLRKTEYTVTIEDIYPDRKETGTRVIIDIPIKI